MVAVAQGALGSTVRTMLTAWVAEAGVLLDPASLAWVIHDISTDTKLLAPVTIATGTVDLVADRIGVGLGRFGANWTVSGTEPTGLHEIVWTCILLDGSTLSWSQQFDVLVAVGRGQRGYALVSDFRGEGFASGAISDAKLMQKIAFWSDWIDRACDRYFEPRAGVITVDGTGGRGIGLDLPICALNGVAILDTMVPEAGSIDLRYLRVYNRHLTEGLTSPDDRDAPLIEWSSVYPGLVSTTYGGFNAVEYSRWPHGQQNIQVDGVFGYTEADGSPLGCTPSAIRRACQLLVVRDMPALSDGASREDNANRPRLTGERTREQSYTLGARSDRTSSAAGTSYFSGDPAIDDLLEMFVAPIGMGST